jgi:hypothetical protein
VVIVVCGTPRFAGIDFGAVFDYRDHHPHRHVLYMNEIVSLSKYDVDHMSDGGWRTM